MKTSKLGEGAKVQLQFGTRTVTGSVVEDRGPLGGARKRLLTVQLDGDPAAPFELETAEDTLSEQPNMPRLLQERLEALIEGSSYNARFTIGTALRMFRDEVSPGTSGLRPEDVSARIGSITSGAWVPSSSEVDETLSELAKSGVIVRRPSGSFVSTEWLLKYLDETTFQREWTATATRQMSST